MNIERIDLPTFSDERGNLTVIENLKEAPFDFQRVFYVYGVSAGEKRGGHAHVMTEQLLVCVNGGVTVILKDGKEQQTIHINSASKGIIIPAGVWAEQVYTTDNSVLLVLCSHLYMEEDYIRNYEEFLEWKES
tara:strand:- start:202 stop:600 length:399 start_codon:yes stop_codon:yes gene_type:complete